MAFVDTQQIAELLKNRREMANMAKGARTRGFISLADGYDEVVASWDSMLVRYGVTPGAV